MILIDQNMEPGGPTGCQTIKKLAETRAKLEKEMAGHLSLACDAYLHTADEMIEKDPLFTKVI